MRIFDLALKDISQLLRDKRSFLFLMAMPLIFTFFMGFAMKGAAETPDPRLALGWVNNDPGGAISEQFKSLLQANDGLRLVELSAAEAAGADAQVKSGQLAAAVVVPAQFSADALAGKPVQVKIIADEMSTTGQSAFQLARIPVTRTLGALEVAQLYISAVNAHQPFGSPAERQKELTAQFRTAAQGWQQSADQGAQIVLEKAAGVAQPGQPLGGNPYNQTSPGMIVMFAVFGLVSSATILVQERKTRTLQRMITTSMTPAQIIAGHLLAMFAVVLLQEGLLVVFGQLALKVNYLREPGAVLVVVVAVALWVASLGLLLSVFAKSEEQVTLYSLIAMFLLAGLGGAWFSLEITGPLFSTIGHLTPTAWAMDGFQNILIRGQGFNSVLVPVGVMLAYALVFFGISVWRFKFE
jgi:ABC-2 type transport system permease protein